MDTGPNAVAEEISAWFEGIGRALELQTLGIAPEGPHRDAVVLDALRRNARLISKSDIDSSGKLYTPLCLLIVAACRKLTIAIRVGHWLSALENVVQLESQAATVREKSFDFGLEVGSPATLFKQQLDESLRQAGLVDSSVFLDRDNREVALGLAINWAMRFLLAYALEIEPETSTSHRKDLYWLANQIRPLQTERLAH